MPPRLAFVALLLLLAACDSGPAEPVAPVLSECTVSADTIEPGEEIVFGASLNSDAQDPVLISIDWGDGQTESVNSFPLAHTYDASGSYTATATAINPLGSSSCRKTVEVSDPFCDDLEFVRVSFPFGVSTLGEKDLPRLQADALALRRCTNVCLTIQAYTDDLETDQAALSQARADVVQDYYVSQGVARIRIPAQGLGQDPNSDSAGTPGQGDFRARRAEFIAGICTQ